MSIGSILMDKRMRNKDIKGVMLLGALAAAGACGIFLWSQTYFSGFLMVIMGFGISADMVGVQTMLHNLTEDNTRGIVSGLYSFCFAVGFIFSSVTGPQLYIYRTWFPFMVPIVALILCPIIIGFNFKEKLIFPEKPEGNVLGKVFIGLQGRFYMVLQKPL